MKRERSNRKKDNKFFKNKFFFIKYTHSTDTTQAHNVSIKKGVIKEQSWREKNENFLLLFKRFMLCLLKFLLSFLFIENVFRELETRRHIWRKS